MNLDNIKGEFINKILILFLHPQISEVSQISSYPNYIYYLLSISSYLQTIHQCKAYLFSFQMINLNLKNRPLWLVLWYQGHIQ